MKDLLSRLSLPPSPLQEIPSEVFSGSGLRLLVKRDDLLHPHISGNKWRKLKHNLSEAAARGCDKLVSFGGAYSNHLAAVAAAGREFGFSTMGVVRGEKTEPMNPTLQSVQANGMELWFVSRANFKQKNHIAMLPEKFNADGCFFIPEGGANCLALPGCREMVEETVAQLGAFPDYWLVACGTGTTLAGMLTGLPASSKALGISALKGDFLKKQVAELLATCGESVPEIRDISEDYHFGGYAKFTPALIDFINGFNKKYGIPLDPVYTGKMMFAAFDLAEKGFFKKGSVIVAVHTGGLQGIAGFNRRFGNLIHL